MENRRLIAIPRALIWAALVVFTLYSGIRLATGPGRDLAFDDLTWSGGAIAQVVILTVVFAGLFGRAAYLTYRTEIAAPPAGTFVVPGARLGLFADAFLAIVGGLLMLVGVWMLLRVPEANLAANSPRYRNYHSASVTFPIVVGGFFGAIGFVLMILRRYVWVFRPGKPVLRYWARPFSRGRAVRGIELYWTFFYEQRGAGPVRHRVPVAHWLRARDPSSAGFFRDCDLAFAPYMTPEEMEKMKTMLEKQMRKQTGETHDASSAVASMTASPEQLRAIEQVWQERIAQLTGVTPAVVPEDRKQAALAAQPV